MTTTIQEYIKLIDSVARAFRLDPAAVAQDFWDSNEGETDREVAMRSAANHVILREHNED